ncbi:L-seryl-tRNA(Sec) selenium transferase [Desulfopila aestuarii]|uniref:L-seryl-tRNA(Sec) selenium transferase n=1 Tax=Desulfopila aestuarii DSM 18488 TaxID=1121416 RepID=A0A1M7YGB3_9BACT|nr:L-seryl-tRNA(Sec) selenium transferase [Desulfopila aestuarii]SHO51687.1 L-seryl-tRNA(Sec) selenium transferase [Desulfopila aestuarii DSM 18488]
MESQNELLRSLPKIDECILWLESVMDEYVPHRIIKECVQKVIDRERKSILAGEKQHLVIKSRGDWEKLFIQSIRKKMTANFRRVINGTGVIVHTNLGRSLLPDAALEALGMVGGYYSNLEFDLETGRRGSRYSLVEDLICELTGAESAIVVNNNAAAVLLVLDTLAKGTEVIVSRGQLVEIGGSFRIPDVMAKSGADLVEVGATNRTHLHDYEQAITERTSMLLKVHTSNFRMIGFTSEVSGEDLSALAKKHGLVTMEDLGSGSLLDLSPYGLEKEPTVQEAVKAGIDVVTFSGDKLLGGPQAGVIVGSREVIGKVKKNPLNRALRIDKFTLAALETILRYYYDTNNALESIPTLKMLTEHPDIIKERAEAITGKIRNDLSGQCDVTIGATVSKVGGGAMPECKLASWAVELQPKTMSISMMEKSFRQLRMPIIGRVESEKFLLDARTIQDREISELADLIRDFFRTDVIENA